MKKSVAKQDRFFMSSVKIGTKGQIVIPKEARDMLDIKTGDSLVLLADTKKGIAIQKIEKLHPHLKNVFESMGEEE